MKSLAILSLTAALVAGSSLPAMADSSSSSVSSSSSSSSSQMADTGADNWGQLISSIQTGGAFTLPAITDATNVTFVTVSSIKASGNTNALDNALTKNQSKVTELQTAAEANATLKTKLQAAGYTSAQVVAVFVEADGSVTVVIQD